MGIQKMKHLCLGIAALLILSGCAEHVSPWHMLLSHDETGTVKSGSAINVTKAVRQGCRLRVAWGSRGTMRPDLTIEHVSEPTWIAIRDNTNISVEIGGYTSNLKTVGDTSAPTARQIELGGTEHIVEWRATLKPDGSFDAVWFHPSSGEFIKRMPQQHAMKWFADCKATNVDPLYGPLKEQDSH